MTDQRTPEQRDADDNLTTAVNRVRAAYFPDTVGRLLTDYVVVAADQTFDDTGDPELAIGTLVRDGQQPHYRTVGLLTIALDRARR